MNPHSRRQDLIRAALGQIPCDLRLRGGRYLDVFSCEWREGDLFIHGGVIVGLADSGQRLQARRELDARDRWIVPGFIDAHVHVESSLLTPGAFAGAVLPRGTTTAVCDPHELANVAGARGLSYFLDAAETLGLQGLDLWVMLSSCVPATHLETNGGGHLEAADLAKFARHPRALGLAEMMNVPGILHGDPGLLDKLALMDGRPIDGHCPLLSGPELSAYAAAGIESCHESSQLEEAREKLQKGIAVWIREGSVAKDLDALAPLLTLATSSTLGFCTDDRNPYDIATEGHLDHLVRGAIRHGVPPEVAYRAASWTVARHYGLARGPRRVGAIAPGWQADLVLLGDPRSVALARVLKGGVPVDELPTTAAPDDRDLRGSVRAAIPEAAELRGPAGLVHVIGVEPGKILTGRSVEDSAAPGVARLTVLERHGRSSGPANAYVRGFGANFRGAIASSVGHDSHNLIVVGSPGAEADMRAGLAELQRSGGGFCVVRDGQVRASLELPIGGLMCDLPTATVRDRVGALREASHGIGCELAEPFLQLAFLSLPVIPSLKLTDRGLVDVDRFELIPVQAG